MLAVILMSSAYPWSSYVMYVGFDVGVWYDGLYPLLPNESQRRRGSINNVNRNGESVSPWSVPLSIRVWNVLPTGFM